jgi:crossover junction endodeoxyribonuclease RusA
MKTASLTLPYPPSLNRYYKKYRNRIIVSKEGKDYQEQVSILVSALNYRNYFMGTDRLAMDVLLFPPDNRHRDLDNVFKALCDSLQNSTIFVNDSQLDYLCITRGDRDKANPRAVIKLHLWTQT